MAPQAILLGMNEADNAFFTQVGAREVWLLPAFHPFTGVNILPGCGSYILYHGNLSVNENEAAILNLLKLNIAGAALPLVIAGKNPSAKFKKIIAAYRHVTLMANPGQAQMQQLIKEAHIHILPSANATGIKLKLLNALFNGRHCIVNPAAVAGSSLAPLCHVVKEPEDYKKIINRLAKQEVSASEIEKRRQLLLNYYDNKKNAEKLIAWL